VAWGDAAPNVEMSTFGGKLVTHSTFAGTRGMVIVRPASVSAEPASVPGKVESVAVSVATELPQVKVTGSVEESGAAAPIEEARVIVGAGRGIGSPDGLKVIEDLRRHW
jgi:electron transfer flavoprotein alpha subunit